MELHGCQSLLWRRSHPWSASGVPPTVAWEQPATEMWASSCAGPEPSELWSWFRQSGCDEQTEPRSSVYLLSSPWISKHTLCRCQGGMNVKQQVLWLLVYHRFAPPQPYFSHSTGDATAIGQYLEMFMFEVSAEISKFSTSCPTHSAVSAWGWGRACAKLGMMMVMVQRSGWGGIAKSQLFIGLVHKKVVEAFNLFSSQPSSWELF